MLGGSNSVVKTGLSRGLCGEGDLNLAVGASGVFQNIHAICTNRQPIDETDVIVTESSVNDIFDAYVLGQSFETIQRKIHLYHEELWRTGKPVVSIILPISRSPRSSLPSDLIHQIYDIHRHFAGQYGFGLIDLACVFSDFSPNPAQSKALFIDELHPSDTYLYTLGLLLRQHLMQAALPKRSAAQLSNFFTRTPQCDSEKRNRQFHRYLCTLDQDLVFEEAEAHLVGVETWNDEYCELVIQADHANCVKGMSQNVSFQEILCADLSSFRLRSHLGPSQTPTEPSVGVAPAQTVEKPVKLASLLFQRHDAQVSTAKLGAVSDLSHLAPDPGPFTNSLIQASGKSQNKSDGLLIRDAALALECQNLTLSLGLMQLAQGLRPNGPLIRKKIAEYQERLLASSKDPVPEEPSPAQPTQGQIPPKAPL